MPARLIRQELALWAKTVLASDEIPIRAARAEGVSTDALGETLVPTYGIHLGLLCENAGVRLRVVEEHLVGSVPRVFQVPLERSDGLRPRTDLNNPWFRPHAVEWVRHRSNIQSRPGSPLLLSHVRPGRGSEAGGAAGGHHPEGFATTSCRAGLGSPDDMGWTQADATPSLLPHSGSLPVMLEIIINLEPGIKAAWRLRRPPRHRSLHILDMTGTSRARTQGPKARGSRTGARTGALGRP